MKVFYLVHDTEISSDFLVQGVVGCRRGRVFDDKIPGEVDLFVYSLLPSFGVFFSLFVVSRLLRQRLIGFSQGVGQRDRAIELEV